MSFSTRSTAVFAAASLFLAACSSDSTTAPAAPKAARAFAYAGDGQRITVGGESTDTLVVMVVSSEGAPIANAAVQWTSDNLGTFTSSESRTNADGRAVAIFAAGTRIGTARLTANVEGLGAIPFEVFVLPSSPSGLRAMGALADTLDMGELYTGGGVEVVDQFGNVIDGIAFSVSLFDASDNVISNGSISSDARGIAAVPFVVAPENAGDYRLVFESNALSLRYGITVLSAPETGSLRASRR